jgi:hypothetical protein
MSGNQHEGIQTATTAKVRNNVSLQQALPWPEGQSWEKWSGKRAEANGRAEAHRAVSWLECFASRALNRCKMRPCVAYHEIWLEVDEPRPMALVMEGLRPGVCSSRSD